MLKLAPCGANTRYVFLLTSSLFGGSVLSSRGSGDHRAKYGSRENMPTPKDAITNGAIGICDAIGEPT